MASSADNAKPPYYGMPLSEAFLASENERTFQYDDTLPSLPVPSLDNTLRKYLESVRAVANDEEYRRTESIARQFSSGIGQELQAKLLDKAKHEQNWLEKWWEDYAYLMTRSPHAPYVNFAGPVPYSTKAWPPQVGVVAERTAIIVWYMLQFWQLMRKEKIHVERGGRTTIWSMSQFRRMFSACKTPGKTIDKLNHYFKTERQGSMPSHVLVICRGRYFTFDTLDAAGHVITAPEIQAQLQRVLDTCDHGLPGPGVGALTAENRTTWYELREHLISLHPDNERHLLAIQKALFAVVLDDRMPVSFTEIARESLLENAKNRWLDKSISPITFANGLMGCNCDHAPHDAMVNVTMTIFIYLGLEACKYQWLGPTQTRPTLPPVELVFHVDNRILKAIDDAVILYKKASDSMEIVIKFFTAFGKDYPRSLKLHPDTFMQLAMQFGYYRLHKKPAATYETATTRKFYNARTDTVRSCTVESVEWSKCMLDPTASNEKKLSLFMAAYNKHNKLMAEAMENHGCDRHLLGLQLIALESGMPLPELYTDPSYVKSGGGGNYTLSTSCVGYTPVWGGVAPMCKDGYGFFYAIEPHQYRVFVVRWVDDVQNSAPALYDSVSKSLMDMKQLLDSTKPAKL